VGGLKPLLAVAVVAIVACSGSQGGSSATPGASASPSPLAQASGKLDAEVPTPPGFPSDIPVYTGARLTAGASFTSSGQVTWGMEWETLDSIDKVRQFYAKQLSQGDWSVNFSGATSSGTFSAVFQRKSNAHSTGILGADGTSGVTKISLSFLSAS
jgi:hypothetical protein